MGGSMRGRWSTGVVVAIAVAVGVALWSGEARPQQLTTAAATPTSITLSLQSEGVALRIVRGDLAVTLTI